MLVADHLDLPRPRHLLADRGPPRPRDADRGRRPCARGRGPRRPPLPGAVRRRRRARDRGRLRRQLRQRPAGRQAGRPRAGDRLAGARSTHRADDRRQRGVDDVAADVRPGRRGPVAALRGLVRARLVSPTTRATSPLAWASFRTSRSGSGRPDRMARPVITFLTDFGPSAPAVCRGVMFGIAPDANIIDINHQVPRYSIRDGAGSLIFALPHMPVGTHVAVVDPGVGTERLPDRDQGRPGRRPDRPRQRPAHAAAERSAESSRPARSRTAT